MSIMCDPPSGWRFGFPKIMPSHIKTINDAVELDPIELDEWLVSEGYPLELVEEGMGRYCSYWNGAWNASDKGTVN